MINDDIVVVVVVIVIRAPRTLMAFWAFLLRSLHWSSAATSAWAPPCLESGKNGRLNLSLAYSQKNKIRLNFA